MTATATATATPAVQQAAAPAGLFDAATYLATMNATLGVLGGPHDSVSSSLTPDPSSVATATAAPGESVTSWLWRRVSLLEGQRQTLHRERDEARDALRGARDVIGDQAATIARLRGQLAAAGRSLDELTEGPK